MPKKLKIAQIAPLRFSIPPKKYGGIERIISFITEELVKRGYDLTLFASGSSKTNAKLISVSKKTLNERGIPWQDWYWNIFNHSFAFQMADEFDILHAHCDFMGAFFQKFIKTPVLYTLHNIPESSDHRWKIFDHFKDYLNVVFISKSEQKNSPIRFKKEWVVYNGIDISQFNFNSRPEDYFFWAGRIDPRKGVENVIEIAQRTGINLLLAGPIQPMWKSYFQTKINPRLSSQIKYIGELSSEKLSHFYGKARAFLYPITWEEPFGLIMAEAMASGTPVIAFNRGSVSEVVKNGKTGFVVKNIAEAVRAIKKIDQIDRRECRKWVEEKFSVEKMVDEYEKVYYEILNRNKK